MQSDDLNLVAYHALWITQVTWHGTYSESFYFALYLEVIHINSEIQYVDAHIFTEDFHTHKEHMPVDKDHDNAGQQ